MDQSQFDALRKPFPPEAIGLKPQPYRRDAPKGNCPECGGYHGMPAAHLDFVGHAAVTDRLLAVDPELNWEPVAVDQNGLPLLDSAGNLWIRLTICGTTRLGIGDGHSMKEIIGDAIRNAAYRFGVALDLWSNQELENAGGEISRPSRARAAQPRPSAQEFTEPPADQPVPAVDLNGDPLTGRTRGQMFAMFGQKGITDEDAQRAGMTRVLGRPVQSRGLITEAEGRRVIDSLRGLPDAPPPENAPPKRSRKLRAVEEPPPDDVPELTEDEIRGSDDV